MKWHEQYNCHWANVAPGLRLDITWSNSGYRVNVFGRPLKHIFKNLDAAKASAIRTVKERLKKAIVELNET